MVVDQEAELRHLEVQAVDATVGEGVVTELPECPAHVATSFIKGKPQSIADPTHVLTNTLELFYMFDALSIGMVDTVAALSTLTTTLP